jgi:hypothetical protein
VSALILVRVLFLVLFLAVVYAVQRFWFLRAWSWIGTLSRAHWRFGLHAGLIALAVALFAAFLDPLLGHAVSRASFGKTLVTSSRLWLITSLFALVAVESVGAIEWMTNAAARLRLRTGATALEFDPSRRTFFQYAACLAGSLPFLAAT